jgi:hypothetical protein
MVENFLAALKALDEWEVTNASNIFLPSSRSVNLINMRNLVLAQTQYIEVMNADNAKILERLAKGIEKNNELLLRLVEKLDSK